MRRWGEAAATHSGLRPKRKKRSGGPRRGASELVPAEPQFGEAAGGTGGGVGGPRAVPARLLDGSAEGPREGAERGDLSGAGYFSFTDTLGIRLPSLVIRFDTDRSVLASVAAAQLAKRTRALSHRRREVLNRAHEQKSASCGLVSRYDYSAAAKHGAADKPTTLPMLYGAQHARRAHASDRV